MKINEVEKLIGISKKNIRFYEEQGLLNPDRNRENGYREYSMDDLEQLKRIKFFRKLSIPLEEIRKMQNTYFTLSECMERHLVYLQQEERNLICTREMCRQILDSNCMIQDLEVNSYLETMEKMEREGVHFMDVKKIDQQKRRGSITAAVVMILFAILFLTLLVCGVVAKPSAAPIIGFFIIVTLLFIVGILVVLRQRMKEIKGGEENEASKY